MLEADPGLLERGFMLFVAVFLGWTSQYWPGGFMVLWFYVQEHPKAQPAVVLVLKRLRRRGNGLKSHLTDWEKLRIKPATPALQDIGLSPTPRRLMCLKVWRFALLILSFFLNMPWKWNNLVSLRPNYFIFIGYLKTGGREGFKWALWTPSESATAIQKQLILY